MARSCLDPDKYSVAQPELSAIVEEISEQLARSAYIDVYCPQCKRFMHRFKVQGLYAGESKCRSCKSIVETVAAVGGEQCLVQTQVLLRGVE